MEVIIQESEQDSCVLAARIVASHVRAKPDAVLGLATGTTPIPFYQELVRLYLEKQVDFSRVTTFNLDEYVGLSPEHPQSYHAYMRKNFFDLVNVPEKNIHIPDGMASDVETFCSEYEREITDAGGIDIQLLGIGHDGHIGFNEPTSSLSSRTRIKTLTRQTLEANARFFESGSPVPHHVITMGIGTIMESRTCLMLAYGAGKAAAVARMVEGPLTAAFPASILQYHARAKVILDRAAAGQLTLTEYFEWVYRNKPSWQRP